MSERPALALRLLAASRRFGPYTALAETSLSVARGESLAVFGANGAGKSTLLKVASGLLRPTAGIVEVFERALPGDPSLRRRIGVMSHESFLYPDLSAVENLEYYGRLYGVSTLGRVQELLEDLGLTEFAERAARTYSRGMTQRLSLARAMLHRPDLLILDEPMSGLDPAAAELAEGLLRRARAEGITLVFTSHDFGSVGRVASRALLLDRGRIAWDSGDAAPSVDAIRGAFGRVTSAS
jgi:heme exporter protein A